MPTAMGYRMFEYAGAKYTCKQLLPIASKSMPGITYQRLYSRLTRMPTKTAVEGKEVVKKLCICGCGMETVNGAKYYDIKKCQHAWRVVYTSFGCCQPDEWRVCKCGKEFPVFLSIFPTQRKKTYCSTECVRKYATGGCSPAGRRGEAIKDRSVHCFREKGPFTHVRCARYAECDFQSCQGYEPEKETDDIMKGYRRSSLASVGRIVA